MSWRVNVYVLAKQLVAHKKTVLAKLRKDWACKLHLQKNRSQALLYARQLGPCYQQNDHMSQFFFAGLQESICICDPKKPID